MNVRSCMTTDKRHTGELIPGGQAGIRAGWQADGKATPGWKANRQAGKQEWADRCLHEQPVTLAQKNTEDGCTRPAGFASLRHLMDNTCKCITVSATKQGKPSTQNSALTCHRAQTPQGRQTPCHPWSPVVGAEPHVCFIRIRIRQS